MEYAIGILLGMLLVIIFVKKPLTININRTYKDLTEKPKEEFVDVDAFLKQQLEDSKGDDKSYAEINTESFLEAISDIMNGGPLDDEEERGEI